MNTLVQAIQQRYQGDFMTVGITGSVAVGKSTFAGSPFDQTSLAP